MLELIAAIVISVVFLLIVATALKNLPSDSPIFVVNGFYMSMRDQYTSSKAAIYYYCLEWDQATLPFKKFREEVLGNTDPKEAASGSIRNTIFQQWQSLGLSGEPDIGLNGVHGSASPFEAMAERLNWLEADMKGDTFSKVMTSNNIPKDKILEWTKDPQVSDGKQMASFFDQLEDMDATPCAKQIIDIAVRELKWAKKPKSEISVAKNEAFFFIKPPANNQKVRDLCLSTFAKHGITVKGGMEGEMSGPTIDQNKYIDNHYLSIADKASLKKPAELNPTAEAKGKFTKKFDVEWDQVVRRGEMFNAKDACSKFGCDGNALDIMWGKAKKEQDKVAKLGGGFSVAFIDPAACKQ